MIKILLITMGLTLLIFVPIVFVASIIISDIKTQLWNEAPEQMTLFQNGINGFYDSIGSFIIGNWFTIFLVISIIIIIYILTNIYYEIRYKKIIGGQG